MGVDDEELERETKVRSRLQRYPVVSLTPPLVSTARGILPCKRYRR